MMIPTLNTGEKHTGTAISTALQNARTDTTKFNPETGRSVGSVFN